MTDTREAIIKRILDKEKSKPEITTFETETLSDLMNDSLPPEEWLIDGIIPAEGFTFIVGAEATGKSFYTLSIAKAIITKEPWLGQFPVIKQTKILFMDKENSRRRTQNRAKGLGIIDHNDDIYRIKTPHIFTLTDSKGKFSNNANKLSNLVREKGIGLIILDSFADFMLGSENSVEDVQKFYSTMRGLFPGIAVLVLHHENKPSQGVARTSSQRVRGSTNITAQLVSGFRVFAIPKTTNEFVLEQFKAGDAEKMKPFKVQLVSTPSPYDPTKTYVSEVKHNGPYYDEEGKSVLAEDFITEYLTDNTVGSRSDILSHCVDNGISERTAATVLSDLYNKSILEKIKEGHKVSYLLK